MLYVRRTRSQWIDAEYVGRCGGCGEASVQFDVGRADRCIRCSLNASVDELSAETESVGNPALPW
jgi:hypothetical protein